MQYFHDVDDRLFPDPPNTTGWPTRVVNVWLDSTDLPHKPRWGCIDGKNVAAMARSLFSMISQSFFYQPTWVRDVCG